MQKRLLLLLLLLASLMAKSQENVLGNWLIYFGNVQMNERWNWHNELQYRNYNAFGDLEQLLIRTGIGRNLTEDNNNLLLGYGYILSSNYIGDTDEKESFAEHRIYQQFISKQTDWRVKLLHRYRFEQRFFENDFRLRFRYFLSLNIPLNHKNMEDHTWYVSVYDELFVQTENVIFDRNRLYGGLGFRVSSGLRFELAYMTQMFSAGSRDQINMVCFLSL